MFPDLFSCGELTLRAYGLMLAISFLAGMLAASWRADRRGIEPKHVFDLSLVILVTSIIGARLFHFFFHYSSYAITGEPFLQLLRIWDGGLMLFGGFVFALVGSIIYLKIKKLPLWELTDILSPSVMLGLGFTRIGCFLNGCCYGKPTDSWLGVVYPNNAPVYFSLRTHIHAGTPVYPTQLMESIAGFAFFGLLILVERKWKRFHGFTFGLMVTLFGLWRLFIEEFRFREDDMHAFWGLLSKNQIISIVIVLAGIAILVWRWLYVKKKGQLLDPKAELATIHERAAKQKTIDAKKKAARKKGKK
ncbi:prolipoprotein diacylglyceryl transferase [bacterium]|nr:prolipoprotein diacylglyceryl transferase [bacterium]